METGIQPEQQIRRKPGGLVCALLVLMLAHCSPLPPPENKLLHTSTYASNDLKLPLEISINQTRQPILVEVSGQNTHYRSLLLRTNGETHSEIELDFLRSAPVYHVIDANEEDAHWTLNIQPMQVNNASFLTINQFLLPQNPGVIEAWKQLSQGMQRNESQSADAWQSNLSALQQAGNEFTRLGLQEPAMWAHYYSAYFQYYPLYRYSEALAIADSLIRDAHRAGLPALELLAHQLAGQIRIEREADNDEVTARENYLQAQEHFRLALEQAQTLGNEFERIWSLNNSGITHHYQDQPEQSLQRYQQALDLALELDDAWLIELIGTNVTVSQEKLGLIDEAIETLQQRVSRLDPAAQQAELAHVQTLLGRYYLKLYRFPQALDALNQALEIALLDERAESRGRVRLLLGQVYREMGQPDKSLLNLQLAIPDLEQSRNGRGLRRAWALSADINRLLGNPQAAFADRQRQEHYLATDTDRAEWLSSKGQDAEAASQPEQAIDYYQRSAALYSQTEFTAIGQLARLRSCVLQQRLSQQPGCSTASLQPAYAEIQSLQASQQALEGKYLWAQIHALQGSQDTALDITGSLINDMKYYRQSLPGILGAWYWDARRQVFDYYMQLILQGDTSAAGNSDLAMRSFKALNELRNAQTHIDSGSSWPEPASTEASSAAGAGTYDEHQGASRIRSLLARRDQASSAEEQERVQRQIDQYLLSSRTEQITNAGEASDQLAQQLNALPEGWSVLTYYFSDIGAYAWTGDRQGMKLHELGDGQTAREGVKQAKDSLRVLNSRSLTGHLSELGELLIEPIKRDLQPNILFVEAGILSDFPLEAVIHNGEFLIRHHQIANVMSADQLAEVAHKLQQPFSPQRVFLAGNPLTDGQQFNALTGAAGELETIAGLFSSTELVAFKGPQLRTDAFNRPEFTQAELIHIASHATIDMEYPNLSRILLSGGSPQQPAFITPADLAGKPIAAQLVMLSACSTVGLNRFEYDSNLGFVSEFLRQGSGQVVASLWPVPDRATAQLMERFYRNMQTAPSISAALRSTKLQLVDADSSSVNQWAAFQLFTE